MSEIVRSEGIYGIVAGNIYFDCKCGGKKCHYKSSEVNSENSEVSEAIRKDD